MKNEIGNEKEKENENESSDPKSKSKSKSKDKGSMIDWTDSYIFYFVPSIQHARAHILLHVPHSISFDFTLLQFNLRLH